MSTTDEFAGQGGSYELNPDGTRTLVERTQDPADAPAENTEAAEPAKD